MKVSFIALTLLVASNGLVASEADKSSRSTYLPLSVASLILCTGVIATLSNQPPPTVKELRCAASGRCHTDLCDRYVNSDEMSPAQARVQVHTFLHKMVHPTLLNLAASPDDITTDEILTVLNYLKRYLMDEAASDAEIKEALRSLKIERNLIFSSENLSRDFGRVLTGVETVLEIKSKRRPTPVKPTALLFKELLPASVHARIQDQQFLDYLKKTGNLYPDFLFRAILDIENDHT